MLAIILICIGGLIFGLSYLLIKLKEKEEMKK